MESYALLRKQAQNTGPIRLVLAGESLTEDEKLVLMFVYVGGYDPRLEDNISTLESLISLVKTNSLSYNIIAPSTSRVVIPSFEYTPNPTNPDVLFLLNFSTPQRSALLNAPSTLALLYTPTNEHFGVVPVEGMICGIPVLATNTGGPTESILDRPSSERTGWLCPPEPQLWADALREIVNLSDDERKSLSLRARRRALEMFTMDAMAKGLEAGLNKAVASFKRPDLTLFYIVTFAILSVLTRVLFCSFVLP